MAWPTPMRIELNEYVHSRKIQLLGRGRNSLPCWVHLPAWLLQCYKPKPSTIDKSFLADVLWGQFCLYLSVRIKDDLLDRDTRSRSLFLAADLLQLEALRIFSNHIPRRSAFWALYFDSIRITTQAMIRADNLQKTWRGNPGALLKLYAGSAILKIASAAVCFHFRKGRDFPHASLVFDELAVAGQLLDDLEDLDADWRRKRYNSVVRIMLGQGKLAFDGRASSMRRVKRELVMGGFDRVLQMVLDRIDRAEKAFRAIRSRAQLPELADAKRRIEHLRDLLHRENVRLFFSRGQGTGR